MSGMLMLTGDTHQDYDIHKLTTKHFPIQSVFTKDDVLVILGDAGFVWAGDLNDKYWQDWMSEKTFTTFCVLGNHENYDLIEKYPITERFGGPVREIAPSLYYAAADTIYTINDIKCLVINGADSHDKHLRTPRISWWEQEQIPMENIDKILFDKDFPEPDIILSHCAGEQTMGELGFEPSISDHRLQFILDQFPDASHYCGHMHIDRQCARTRILYDEIIEVRVH